MNIIYLLLYLTFVIFKGTKIYELPTDPLRLKNYLIF